MSGLTLMSLHCVSCMVTDGCVPQSVDVHLQMQWDLGTGEISPHRVSIGCVSISVRASSPFLGAGSPSSFSSHGGPFLGAGRPSSSSSHGRRLHGRVSRMPTGASSLSYWTSTAEAHTGNLQRHKYMFFHAVCFTE